MTIDISNESNWILRNTPWTSLYGVQLNQMLIWGSWLTALGRCEASQGGAECKYAKIMPPLISFLLITWTCYRHVLLIIVINYIYFYIKKSLMYHALLTKKIKHDTGVGSVSKPITTPELYSSHQYLVDFQPSSSTWIIANCLILLGTLLFTLDDIALVTAHSFQRSLSLLALSCHCLFALFAPLTR